MSYITSSSVGGHHRPTGQLNLTGRTAPLLGAGACAGPGPAAVVARLGSDLVDMRLKAEFFGEGDRTARPGGELLAVSASILTTVD